MKNAIKYTMLIMAVNFLCIFQSSLAQKKKNDFSGKVKSIRHTSSSVTEEDDKTQKWCYLTIYDTTGNLIEYYDYDINGTLSYKEIYKFYNNDKIAETTRYKSDGKTIDWKKKYKYTYDDKGRVLGEKIFDFYGIYEDKETYKSPRIRIYEYDDEINEVKIYNKETPKFARVDHYQSIKYDSNGLEIENKMRFSLTYYHYRTSKYDLNGNLIESNIESFYIDEGDKYRTTFKYDDKGNQIELKRYDERSKTCSTYNYQYEFDQYGNWTKRIMYIKTDDKEDITKPQSTTERILIYYE